MPPKTHVTVPVAFTMPGTPSKCRKWLAYVPFRFPVIGTRLLPGLFTMFAQLHGDSDRAEGGLGIGLALVKGLVELHGGRVEARSAGIGRGSEFVIHLPPPALAPTMLEPEIGMPGSSAG